MIRSLTRVYLYGKDVGCDRKVVGREYMDNGTVEKRIIACNYDVKNIRSSAAGNGANTSK